MEIIVPGLKKRFFIFSLDRKMRLGVLGKSLREDT